MNCANSHCPIKNKGPGWICSCEPPDQSDRAIFEITDQVAKDMKKKSGKK